jgi:ABC-type polysaccharide/polyol phosphate export permease
MTGIIEGFRSALFGTDWDGAAFSASAFAAAAVLAVGLVTFRSLERRFADYL